MRNITNSYLQYYTRHFNTRGIVCEYLTADGMVNCTEILSLKQYELKIRNKWRALQRIAGGSSNRWPCVMCSLFYSTLYTDTQCGEMAGFAVMNDIKPNDLIEWFALMRTRHRDRILVLQMIHQLRAAPHELSFVYAFSVKQLQYKYIYGGRPVLFEKQQAGMYNTYTLT